VNSYVIFRDSWRLYCFNVEYIIWVFFLLCLQGNGRSNTRAFGLKALQLRVSEIQKTHWIHSTPLLLLLQSALQLLWVLAWSTIAEYSQQEDFYRVASGTSNPQLGGPVIRTFQLPPPDVPHAWNDASEPQQRKVELWARNCREFLRKWWLPRHLWVV